MKMTEPEEAARRGAGPGAHCSEIGPASAPQALRLVGFGRVRLPELEHAFTLLHFSTFYFAFGHWALLFRFTFPNL